MYINRKVISGITEKSLPFFFELIKKKTVHLAPTAPSLRPSCRKLRQGWLPHKNLKSTPAVTPVAIVPDAEPG